MVRSAILLIAFAVASTHSLAAASGSSESTAIKLREAALAGHAVAYSWVSELTTRIGPRPAGSANEQLAANWAANKFKEMGFENVQIESFPLTEWIRGPESAEIISPGTQPLAIAALGESPATPPGGIEGDVALFPTLDDLIAAPEGSLSGRLAVVTRKLVRTQDTAGYAAVASARFKGPIEAARRGAIGFLIRSLGTDSHRIPHTGSTGFVDGHPVIPSFALSGPDADQIERLVHSGQTVVRHPHLKRRTHHHP